MTKSDYARRAVALSVTTALGMAALLLVQVLFSFVLSSVFYAQSMIFPATLVSAMFGGFVSGYFFTKRFEKKLLLTALLAAAVLGVFLCLVGLFVFRQVFFDARNSLSVLSAVLVGGILGGLLRANA